jgi:hypothetical protein
MSLTRREFLQAIGISGSVVCFLPTARLTRSRTSDEQIPELLARLFQNHGDLLEDSVHPILEVGNEWYRLPSGVIDRRLAQPLLARDYHPPTTIIPDPALGLGWAQVAAPSVVLYFRPDVHLDVYRRDHGNIMEIVDILPPANEGDVPWAAVRNFSGDEPLWTQAHLWSPVRLNIPSPDLNRSAEIDSQSHILRAYEGDEPVFAAPFSYSHIPNAERFRVERHQPVTHNNASFGLYLNENTNIGSASWHNEFGRPVEFARSTFELSIYAARALYEFLPDGAEIRVM